MTNYLIYERPRLTLDIRKSFKNINKIILECQQCNPGYILDPITKSCQNTILQCLSSCQLDDLVIP